MPERIQLSRAKGFNLQAASMALNGLPAVNCSRPGPWGNEYVVWHDPDDRQWLVTKDSCHWPVADKAAGIALAVEKHAADLRAWLAKQLYPPAFMLRELSGKNLACWCKLGQPCHADVLLELANR